jgi:hypothetical protein
VSLWAACYCLHMQRAVFKIGVIFVDNDGLKTI